MEGRKSIPDELSEADKDYADGGGLNTHKGETGKDYKRFGEEDEGEKEKEPKSE